MRGRKGGGGLSKTVGDVTPYEKKLEKFFKKDSQTQERLKFMNIFIHIHLSTLYMVQHTYIYILHISTDIPQEGWYMLEDYIFYVNSHIHRLADFVKKKSNTDIYQLINSRCVKIVIYPFFIFPYAFYQKRQSDL